MPSRYEGLVLGCGLAIRPLLPTPVERLRRTGDHQPRQLSVPKHGDEPGAREPLFTGPQLPLLRPQYHLH